MKVGRKSKIDDWLQPDALKLIEGMCRAGFTDKDICKRIGISQSTFYDWCRKFPQFSQTIKRNKEFIDYAVESKLLERCLGMTLTTTKVETFSDGSTRTTTTTREIPPDVSACIRWLTNRVPSVWKMNPDILERELLDAKIENLDARTAEMRGENMEVEDLTETDLEIYGQTFS